MHMENIDFVFGQQYAGMPNETAATQLALLRSPQGGSDLIEAFLLKEETPYIPSPVASHFLQLCKAEGFEKLQPGLAKVKLKTFFQPSPLTFFSILVWDTPSM